MARTCSECPTALPTKTKHPAWTCSGRCRQRRSRRLRREEIERTAALLAAMTEALDDLARADLARFAEHLEPPRTEQRDEA